MATFDDRLFGEFVAARSTALLRTAYLLTGDRHHAEDLLQSALAKTYLALKRLGAVESVEAYARKALATTATSWWRRAFRRRERAVPDLADVADFATPDATHQVNDRHAMVQALQALPAMQRAVIVLRYYDDMPVADIAATLKISVGTVKSHTHRAVATLRKALSAPDEATQSIPPNLTREVLL